MCTYVYIYSLIHLNTFCFKSCMHAHICIHFMHISLHTYIHSFILETHAEPLLLISEIYIAPLQDHLLRGHHDPALAIENNI